MQSHAFERRYLFTGTLTLKTGLHVGSGWVVGSPSDNPVIRTPDGKPFIPGSSFKGAFRSTVEKLAETVGLRTCLLDHDNESSPCLTPQDSKLGKALRTVRGYQHQVIHPNDEDGAKALDRLGRADWVGQRRISESDILALLEEHLCDTCKLFGSPYAASRIFFSDLLPPEGDTQADKMIQVRDGVAIDRDSEKAVDRLKYDYEAVAPAQTFKVEILLEDPDPADLALTCLGLSEFVSGLGYVGGKRSRGLGNCQIDNLAIYELDLTVEDMSERVKRLKNYLLEKTPEKKMTQLPDAQAFLEQQIMNLPVFKKEGSHA